MASIQSASIAFANPQVQDKVKVSFTVRFTQSELGNQVSGSINRAFPNLGPQLLGISSVSYKARVIFNVIRIIPQPYVVGSPPPPLPDPVNLSVDTVAVKLPLSGSSRSINVSFSYSLGTNNNFITDHLHAEIILYRTFRNLGFVFTQRQHSRITNDLVLTVSDLASPQPNGIVIP